MGAMTDIRAERRRQIEEEGYSPAHDDKHDDGSLLRAGIAYFLHAKATIAPPRGSTAADVAALQQTAAAEYPWASKWWKPSAPRRDLVKAGALALAERERLRRLGRYVGHVDQRLCLITRLIRRIDALK